MKVYYKINYSAIADYGDGNLYKTVKQDIKKIKIKDVLQSSLERIDSYKKLIKKNDIQHCMNAFLNDFENCTEIKMMHLNARDDNLAFFKKELEKRSDKKLTYKNIVFLGRNELSWGQQTASIFTNLIIEETNNIIQFKFEIKRIEFNVLNILYDDERYFQDIRKIEFIEFPDDSYEVKKCFSGYSYSKEIEIITNLKKLIKIFGKDSVDDPNKFRIWFNLIRWLNKYFDSQSESNKLFIYPLNNKDIWSFKDMFLLSKSSKLSETRNFESLYSANDTGVKIPIKIKKATLENSDTDFKLRIEQQIKKINSDKSNNQQRDNEFDKYILDLKTKNSNLDNKIKENKEQLDDKELKLENEKQTLNSLLNNQKKLETKQKEHNKDKDILEEIKKLDLEIKKSNDFIKVIQEEINFLENEIKTFNKEQKTNKDNISSYSLQKQNIFEENKKLDLDLQNFNILLTSFDKNNWHAFEANFEIGEHNEDLEKFEHEIIYDLSLLENSSHNFISENLVGLRDKLKRYKNALDNTATGCYKNPYLVYSLVNIPEISKKHKISNETLNKYKLNEKQKIATEKALSVSDTFYLQGPPGTGKTQTICAISEELIKNNNNVLMTSSTHEAISNFMDRLDEKTKSDPNFIIFKYVYKSKNPEKHFKFSEPTLYPSFINRIKNYILDNEDELKKTICKLNDSYRATLINNKYLNEQILNSVKNKIENNKKLNNLETSIWEALCKFYPDLEEDITYFEDVANLELKKNKKIFNNEELNKVLDEIYKIWYSNNDEYLSINEIESTCSSSSSLLENKVSKYFKNENLNDKLENNEISFITNIIDKNNEVMFLDYISKNNLINVVGITTTAKTTFEINKQERDLFIDYPIDTVIIDEISKSCTPEILARAILSRRVLFCGDYNQLPPTSEISESLIENIFSNNNYSEIQKELKELFLSDSNYSEDEIHKNITNEIQKLYENSFFTNQINSIKESTTNKKKSYEYLTKQHRFSKDIMDLVNIYYPGEELEMGQDNSVFVQNRYELKIDGTSYKNYDTILIDTTEFNEKYKEKIEKKLNIKKVPNEAFDQKQIIFNKFDKKNEGIFNEYNAEICLEICSSLINENKNLFNKIGIICPNANQKKLIKKLIDGNDQLSRMKIKVDTIDNFQGREKEIIIVDFVRAKNIYKDNNIREGSENRDLEFISSDKRNNVALSRAKNKLILIGAFKYYKKSKSKISESATQYLKRVKKIIDWSKLDEGDLW